MWNKEKRRLLQMHYEAGVGHIGGNLSCMDILLTLYHHVLTPDDVFILSKGHAAGALYIALWSKGLLTDEDLQTFHGGNTLLPGHPSPGPHIPFATGSLGHGLPLACGIALSKKLRGEPGRVFCLTSDGEWQEGSNWEALTFMVAHDLPVTVLVDENKLQGFNETSDVVGLESDLFDRMWSFGTIVSRTSGHTDFSRQSLDCPGDVIFRTVKGNGVSFLENRIDSHYLPMSKEQYEQALKEIGE